MDLIILDDVATSVVKWRMYPYFDIAHYILMSTAVRDDTPQSGSASFSRKHPFACWFATMLMCFGGSILSNFVMGEPIFTCFDDYRAVLTATAVCTTEISLLAAVVYYCEHLGMIPLPSNQVFLIVVGVLVYLRVAMLVLGVKDPFAPIQNLTCTIFFGGIVDALKAAVSPASSDAAAGPPTSPGATSASGAATGQMNMSSSGMITGGPTGGSSSSSSGGGGASVTSRMMANTAGSVGESSANQSGSNSPFPGSKNGVMRRGATPLQDKKAV